MEVEDGKTDIETLETPSIPTESSEIPVRKPEENPVTQENVTLEVTPPDHEAKSVPDPAGPDQDVDTSGNTQSDHDDNADASASSDCKDGDSNGTQSQDKLCATGFKMPTFGPLRPKIKTNALEESAFVKSAEKSVQENAAINCVKPPKPPINSGSDSSKSKLSHLSPAERLKQTETPIPYKEPNWGGLSQRKYAFEIVKNGSVIDTYDLSTKSFHVFGRLINCDHCMEHPSLSRHHAVLQFCAVENERHPIGWYVYDLDSTHGTTVNKYKLAPRVYHPLKVGHMVKFAGSSRLFILQVSFTSCLRLVMTFLITCLF